MTESNTTELIISKVDAAVTTLSSKLGVATDHFYPILVKQQVISGYLDLLVATIFLIATGAAAHSVYWMHTSDKADIDYVGWSYIFATIFLITGTATGISGALSIINPEYYAVRDIAGFIK